MTAPIDTHEPTQHPPRRSRASTASLYLVIGTLLAAAVLGGYFIIVGDQAAVAARAWLTLFLVAAFAGAVVLDANVSDGPNRWYLGASTIVNVILVAVGLLKIWGGWLQPADTADPGVWSTQLGRLLAVIALLRVALLVNQLYGLYFVVRAKTNLTKYSGVLTIALVWATALILATPAAFPVYDWPDWWWRMAGATALVALVATVIPVIVRAFEPKDPKPVGQVPVNQVPQGYAQFPQQGYPMQQMQQMPPHLQHVPPHLQQVAPPLPQVAPAPPVPQAAPPAPAAQPPQPGPSSPAPAATPGHSTSLTTPPIASSPATGPAPAQIPHDGSENSGPAAPIPPR